MELTRRQLLGSAGAAGAASLSGCLGFGSSASKLRYTTVLPPLSIDPVEVDDAWTRQVAGQVFEGLYEFGGDMSLQPRLAAGEPRKRDETTYEVSLAEGATFQNGEPVTAEDVAYSLTAPVEEETPAAWIVEPIDQVRTVDERTVRVELSHPYPTIDYALTRPIVPKSVREANRKKFGKSAKHTVGSGPYAPETITPAKYARLSADGSYWGGSPSVEDLRFVPNEAGLARTMALRLGQSEIVERIQPKLWKTTEEMPGTSVERAKSYHSVYVGFNCNGGPTADPKVREAIDHLLSMDDAVKHFVGPTGRRQYSPLPEQLATDWEFPREKWKEIPARKNVERAKTLLDESEKDLSGWTPLIAVPPDKMRHKFAEAIVHGLNEVGFKRARTKKYSWKKFREKTVTGNPNAYNMWIGSWSGYSDPDSFLYPLFHENNEGATNGTFYRNEEVMNAILSARETTDRAKRADHYERAITTLLEDRVHLPAFTLDNSFGVKSDVENFQPHPIAGVNPQLVGSGSVTLGE